MFFVTDDIMLFKKLRRSLWEDTYFELSSQPLPKYPLPSALASSLAERGLNCSLSPQVRNEAHGERVGDRGQKVKINLYFYSMFDCKTALSHPYTLPR